MSTTLRRPFAGQTRTFRLPIGKIGELERLCGAGVFAIFGRLSLLQGGVNDVVETIRLALEGGGMGEPEATALATHYFDGKPLADHMQLAIDILSATVNGVPEALNEPGKPEGVIPSASATSPPTTKRAARSASRRVKSTI